MPGPLFLIISFGRVSSVVTGLSVRDDLYPFLTYSESVGGIRTTSCPFEVFLSGPDLKMAFHDAEVIVQIAFTGK